MALDLNDKPWYVPVIVGAVLGGVLFFIMHSYVFKDIKKDSEKITTKIDELEREIEKGRAAQLNLPKLEEEIRAHQIELDRLRRILPTRKDRKSSSGCGRRPPSNCPIFEMSFRRSSNRRGWIPPGMRESFSPANPSKPAASGRRVNSLRRKSRHCGFPARIDAQAAISGNDSDGGNPPGLIVV